MNKRLALASLLGWIAVWAIFWLGGADMPTERGIDAVLALLTAVAGALSGALVFEILFFTDEEQ